MGIPHMRQLALPNPSVEGVQSVTDDYSLIIARIVCGMSFALILLLAKGSGSDDGYAF